MNSRDYWKNRKEWDMFRYMEQADKKAEEISRLYQKASRYLSLEADAIFERYQKKHELSEAEARRLLNTLQDKSSLDELKKALRNGSSDKAKADLLAELEGPAYRARLERLEQLQNQLDSVMQKVYKQEKEIHTNHYVDLGSEAYYRSIFRIQQETGLGFSFVVVDPKTIERIINSRWSGKHYSERIWENTSTLAQDLKEELLINLMTGRTERETAELIANKFAVSASKARRLIRTESCHVSVQMDMEAYRECGIEKYQFLATLDLRTSEVCRKLDNKVFPVSEQCPGKNCPPMHPWCRSTTVCASTAEEMEGLKRRARNPATGKNELVPANMSYEEWKKVVDDGGDFERWEAEQKAKLDVNDKYFVKSVAKDSGSGIINPATAKEVADVHQVGKINRNIYKCITGDIITDEVIITDERIGHIKDRHPNDFERYCGYLKLIVEEPDYIIETSKPNTALILKEIKESDERQYKTVLRLTTSTDNPDFKNSIITFMKINEKEWQRLLRNKKILYKKE